MCCIQKNQGIKGAKNVLKLLGILSSEIEHCTEFACSHLKERIRRLAHPRFLSSGINQFLVNLGDIPTKGHTIAQPSDIYGPSQGDGLIKSEYDDVILNLQNRMMVYPQQPIAEMVIRDDHSIVVPKSKK